MTAIAASIARGLPLTNCADTARALWSRVSGSGTSARIPAQEPFSSSQGDVRVPADERAVSEGKPRQY